MIHSRGSQHQWQCSPPDCQNASGQNFLQQCHLPEECMLHDNGHLQLLTHDTFALSWIHLNKIKWHPQWSSRRIQAQIESHQKWQHLHQSQVWHVQPTISRVIGHQTPQKYLSKHGYRQSKLLPGLWKHDTRPIQYTLVVDNFGVKFVSKEHAQHLKNALKEQYKLMCN